MITLFSRDSVSDYGKWREAFERFQPTLREKGVVASAVYQSVDDPNDITVAHDFETLDAAKAFASSSELSAARPGAGVEDQPTMWFTTRV